MIIPVILSGGTGSRLWPRSRSAFPKPFLTIDGERSLLEKTILRALPLAEGQRIVIVTHRDYYFQTRDCLAHIMKDTSVQVEYLLEPEARNTAAAIALAAFHLQQHISSGCEMLVLPADHVIDQQDRFQEAVQQAAAAARTGKLVTFGVVPDRPETGYGYIKAGNAVETHSAVFDVSRFVEKPDRTTATSMIEEGGYYWNAGMFCFSPVHFLQQLQMHAKEIEAAVASIYQNADQSAEPLGFEAEAYSRIRSDSIDYAVMEKSSEVAVVRATFDWNDIGAWDAVASRFSPDAQGNRSDAETVWVDCQNSFVSSKGRLVALVGCQDLSVIDSDDALLVLKNGNEQKVKKVVEQLQAAGDSRAHFHTTVYRPWGSYTTLAEFPACKVKMIRVNPGAILSLQSHEYRSEHWIVVSGKARVVNGEQEFDLDVNASTWIPQGAKHRLANREQTPLEVIEVQWGSYFGEEDIVRYDDLYGRIEKTGSF